MVIELKPQTAATETEFDTFAENYSAGMENRLKRIAGNSFEQFINMKVRWLLNDLRRFPIASLEPNQIRLLDYGCGTGELLKSLKQLGFAGTVEGCDVSAEMLKEARHRWLGPEIPELYKVDSVNTQAAKGRFDVVILCCVLHHNSQEEGRETLRNVSNLLKSGGRVVIFEHNPWNPVTQWVIRNTPIDQDALLRSSTEVKRLLTEIGFRCLRLHYLMFFPPRLQWLLPVERILSWLPAGGQYAVVAEKA